MMDAASTSAAILLASFSLPLFYYIKQMNNNTQHKKQPPPIVKDLVLIGGGHAHVHVLKMLGMSHDRAIVDSHGIQVTLIAKDILTPYSGMLPGYLAGFYSHDEIHIDLNKLCRFANVRLIYAAAHKITYDNNNNGGGGGLIYCDDGRPPLRYDALSIDIGSAPKSPPPEHVIPVKPISHFCSYFDEVLNRWKNTKTIPDGYRIGVVGGGAGGIEVLLALQHRLLQLKPDAKLEMVLITRGHKMMETHNQKVQEVFRRILKERNVTIYFGAEVTGVQPAPESSFPTRKRLIMKDGKKDILLDDCVWCVTAGVASWLGQSTPFACDESGFIRVKSTYESVSHPGIFAAGDCCHMDEHPRPKAGVFAVRAGPILRTNLLNFLLGKPLKEHRPQKDFLGIISTGDKYGVASKGWWFCLEGKYIWTWKDWIDRKFMRMYSDLPDLEDMMATMSPSTQTVSKAYLKSKDADVAEVFAKDPMRCGGCGAKVGSDTVSRVLRAILKRQQERAKEFGYTEPVSIDHDDAAVVPIPRKGGVMIHTIDYFREMVSDPFIFGKIAAVHALSDVHAMRAAAKSALTLVVAPFAAEESITETNLLQMMGGISDILQHEEIQLIGGHTCEGKELACGLSVNGYAEKEDLLLRKRGGKVGDKIILTKPIGTGALFAADMRALAHGEHIQEAIQSMIKSNGNASRVAMKHKDIHACTDVTGFGFLGHLLEMLMANDLDTKLERIGAVIKIREVPFLAGALEASKKGVFSTLQRENMRTRRAVANHKAASTTYPVEYPLLFDPQTAGGLLFFVGASSAGKFCEDLAADGITGKIVGEIVPYTEIQGSNVNEGACTIGGGPSSGLRIRIGL